MPILLRGIGLQVSFLTLSFSTLILWLIFHKMNCNLFSPLLFSGRDYMELVLVPTSLNIWQIFFSEAVCAWRFIFQRVSSYKIQFSSITLSRLTLCNPMDCSMPGLPVHHQLLELTQTHIHRVGDAIQPSHPLSSSSPPSFNLSQHQGLF